MKNIRGRELVVAAEARGVSEKSSSLLGLERTSGSHRRIAIGRTVGLQIAPDRHSSALGALPRHMDCSPRAGDPIGPPASVVAGLANAADDAFE